MFLLMLQRAILLIFFGQYFYWIGFLKITGPFKVTKVSAKPIKTKEMDKIKIKEDIKESFDLHCRSYYKVFELHENLIKSFKLL